MIIEPSLQAVDPLALAIRSGTIPVRRYSSPPPNVPRPFLLTDQLQGCSCAGGLGLPPDYGILRGLGFVLPDGVDLGAEVPSSGTGNISMLNAIAEGVSFIPGIGPVATVGVQAVQIVHNLVTQFETWLGIGQGRREADLIVPRQNDLMFHLGPITDAITIGHNPTLAELYGYYRDVWMSGVSFMEFVLMKTFTDRRASGQALSTVMPYIDGTCNYQVPAGPKAHYSGTGCLAWGGGTIGGDGVNGMLGAIARAITAAGGEAQTLPGIAEAANEGYKITATPPAPVPTIFGFSTPVAVGIASLALWMWNRR